MSYGEEIMTEMLIQEILNEQEYGEYINRLWGAVKAKVWINAQNESVKISKMDVRYIHNCMAMLKRKLPHYDDWLGDIARSYITEFEPELRNRYPPKDATEGFFDEEEDDFIARSLL